MSSDLVSSVLQWAERSNSMTADLWDAFGTHRTRVTALLEEQQRRVVGPADRPWTPRGTLCLFGSGNSNDVSLRRLLRRFERLELVDIDGAALEYGVNRQLSASERERVRLHGGVDLFGVNQARARQVVVDGRGDAGDADDTGATAVDTAHVLEEFARRRVAATVSSRLPRICDVVAATGLFPMLVQALERMTNTSAPAAAHSCWYEPECNEVVLDALSRSYIDSLAAAARPGGAIVHVSTLVYPFESSDAQPHSRYSEELVWEKHLSQGDFFPGTNPYAFLAMDGGGRLHSAALWGGEAPYWLWRSSLVYAVTWLCTVDRGHHGRR